LIIDDFSDNKFLTHIELYKTTIINSDYPRRGEFLPYYYYLRNKLFDSAVIIHDSVFINKYIDFSVNTYKILWDFEYNNEQTKDEKIMIDILNNDKLRKFYNSKLWKGCFGGMVVITYDYLKKINNTYKIDVLLNRILTRYNRCTFERIIAVLLQIDNKQPSVFGDIHKYCKWGITFDMKNKYKHLPAIKVWTGR
jgi:methyltransferase-like protein